MLRYIGQEASVEHDLASTTLVVLDSCGEAPAGADCYRLLVGRVPYPPTQGPSQHLLVLDEDVFPRAGEDRLYTAHVGLASSEGSSSFCTLCSSASRPSRASATRGGGGSPSRCPPWTSCLATSSAGISLSRGF